MKKETFKTIKLLIKIILLKVIYQPESSKTALDLLSKTFKKGEKGVLKKVLKKGVFPAQMKIVNVSPIVKKNNSLDKENYRLKLASFHIFQKFMNRSYTNKLTTSLARNSYLTSAVLEKITT